MVKFDNVAASSLRAQPPAFEILHEGSEGGVSIGIAALEERDIDALIADASVDLRSFKLPINTGGTLQIGVVLSVTAHSTWWKLSWEVVRPLFESMRSFILYQRCGAVVCLPGARNRYYFTHARALQGPI